MRNIIGLAGEKKAGKDTFADYLVEKHGYLKIGFADEIKRMAMALYDFTPEQMFGPSEERDKPDLRYPLGIGRGYLIPRIVLQDLGEAMRQTYEHTWVDKCYRIIDAIEAGTHVYDQVTGLRAVSWVGGLVSVKKPNGYVIPDHRHPNEISRTRYDYKGLVLRLRNSWMKSSGVGDAHISETALSKMREDEFDATVQVPQGKDLYYAAIEKVLGRLPLRR